MSECYKFDAVSICAQSPLRPVSILEHADRFGDVLTGRVAGTGAVTVQAANFTHMASNFSFSIKFCLRGRSSRIEKKNPGAKKTCRVIRFFFKSVTASI